MEKTLEQVKAILDKPLPDEAVTPHPTKPYLSNIKAIYVVERFNEAFGLGGWTITNEVVEAGDKMIVVKSSFHAPKPSVNVLDIFGGNDNADRGDAYKGACTDALTKIGSYLGVGMNVYKGKQSGKKAETGVPKPYVVPSYRAAPGSRSVKATPHVSAPDTADGQPFA